VNKLQHNFIRDFFIGYNKASKGSCIILTYCFHFTRLIHHSFLFFSPLSRTFSFLLLMGLRVTAGHLGKVASTA